MLGEYLLKQVEMVLLVMQVALWPRLKKMPIQRLASGRSAKTIYGEARALSVQGTDILLLSPTQNRLAFEGRSTGSHLTVLIVQYNISI